MITREEWLILKQARRNMPLNIEAIKAKQVELENKIDTIILNTEPVLG